MKHYKMFFIVSSLLALFALSGCSSSDLVEKSNEQRISEQRMKIGQLRSEDVQILSEIDSLLNKCEALINEADKVIDSDSSHATLLLETSEAVLVQANTRRLWAVRRASYDTAQQAYVERAGRIQKIREAIEKQLPAIREAN